MNTPTPETPAELAAKAKAVAIEARDWFARFEFEEARYREGNGHSSLRLEALNRTHDAIDRLESLATLAASSTAPAGFVLVPVEPTEAMCKAAVIFANGNAVYKNVTPEVLRIEEGIYSEVYAAMLAARPMEEKQ